VLGKNTPVKADTWKKRAPSAYEKNTYAVLLKHSLVAVFMVKRGDEGETVVIMYHTVRSGRETIGD